jgi:predicted RNase H-like nuclease (RuvC/YqgF family)
LQRTIDYNAALEAELESMSVQRTKSEAARKAELEDMNIQRASWNTKVSTMKNEILRLRSGLVSAQRNAAKHKNLNANLEQENKALKEKLEQAKKGWMAFQSLGSVFNSGS